MRTGAAATLAVVVAAAVTVGCGAGDAPPFEAASPAAACEEAFAAAAEAAERADVDDPRSPDLDALGDTLEACGTADGWLTAARGHPAALPLELDRASALDLLCEDAADTPVCRDWDVSAEEEEDRP